MIHHIRDLIAKRHFNGPAPSRAIDHRDFHPDFVTSAEPAVVFSSLAQLCAPSFSDICTVDIQEEGGAYHIRYPRKSSPPPAAVVYQPPDVRPRELITRSSISTRIESTQIRGCSRYDGVVTFTWHSVQPTQQHAAVARVLVDRASAAVDEERLALHHAGRQS